MAINVGVGNYPEYNINSSLHCISTSEKSVVNNRIEDIQKYRLTGRNDVLKVNPQSIFFHGFELGARYCQILTVINVSQECQRVHIFAPICKEFNIKHENKHKLYPGMSRKILIEFKPKENNFLQDSIRISCKDISDLNVPIYAYLYLDLASTFPTLITFKPTVVGLSDVKNVPLQNNTPVSFDFQIVFIEKNAFFNASPLEGVLPGNSCINITLKYSPLEFCTSVSKLQILISQFNSKPHSCTLIGSCQPGLAAKLKEKEQEVIPKIGLDPEIVSPLGRLRVKKLVSKSISKQNCKTNEIEVDGIRFPKNLHSIAAVNYVLMQKPNPQKEEATISLELDCSDSKPPSKQMKEVLFEDIVNKNVKEEQRNHISWHVHLGEEIVSETYKDKVINDRTQGFVKSEDMQKQVKKYNTVKLFKKTCRPANSELELEPSFFLYKNDDWEKRHIFLQKFIQVARKVIIHNRLLKILKSLSSHLPQWKQGKFELQQTKTYQEDVASKTMEKFFECHFIKPCIKSFIKGYGDIVEPEPYLLGLIDIKPTEVLLTSKPELFNLEVPQQYKLLSYTEVPYDRHVTKHISKRLPRKFKTGLESIKPKTSTSEEKNVSKPLLPPAFFQESIQYHPLHIFNPLPGIQKQPQPLAYSEIDNDYGLCPLNMSNQYNHLMHNEKNMIPEMMCWKKFASQGLIVMQKGSFENTSIPQLNGLFNNELLSLQIPPILKSLPDDDIMEECSEMEFFDYPTMDFVKSNFKTSFCLQKEVTTECISDSTSQPLLQSSSKLVSRESNNCDKNLFDRMQENLLNIQQSWNVSKAFEDTLRTS
ncbi:cilia- and flagella-associated protein 221 isoform X1 [Hydra vulgaris]|uniref:cilia- and flagella-associated protein 221 isoform X1 n=1 Tax=Hydra vulgaris TaxID=6087 RepID=UPI001F5F7F6A|nr:cilia- and flagella-associated protein 221 [Hydra vulgaris]